MLDYRNHLKRILQETSGDEKSLRNGLAAIKTILAMTDDQEQVRQPKAPLNQIVENNQYNKEIKELILGLASLINSPGDASAKKQSLTNLHKLTFAPGIGKNFGKEIGKLDQAIQSSAESSAAANAKIFKQAVAEKKKEVKRDYRKGKRYLVIRLLSGADLVNDNGQTVFTVKESQIHSLNLKSGDIVEALPSADPNYEAEILRVVGFQKLRKRDYDQIEEFKFAVVQGRSGQLTISRDIHGKKLKIRGKEIVLPVSANYYQGKQVKIEDGAVVDLAWYTGDVRLKQNPADAIQIRWIYQVEQPSHKQSKKKQKKDKKRSEDQSDNLDLNLHYQRVGIAIGDNQNETILEKIVDKYYGIPIAIDAFEGRKKVMERQIQELDIVILVTAFAAHDSTWNIREFASKYHVKFAVSSSKGYQSFERALYRAANGLPAYEGTQSIEYKVKNK